MSEETIGTLAVKVKNHKERLDGHTEDIERIKNRLPIWATFFMSFLTAIIGGSLTAIVAMIMRAGASIIIVAVVLSGCATTALTTSTSTPVFNGDGTITFNEQGDYPKAVTIEVKAKAGPLGSLESWMLDTDVTRNDDGSITFHTGNTGSGMKGLDPEAFTALILVLLQALQAAS